MTTSRLLTPRDPERIGGHHLLGRLGEGGQGVVYLAEDESGTRVALKVLHDRGGSRDAFLKEISAARKVASFCTAEILHVGEDEDLPHVVTEFIDGPSLRELVEEKGPQSGPALYRLAIGTATALAAIHQAGIVHRDFKPGNVLVGPDGPRVIDFGVARSVDATVTAASTVIGTPSYMAPEQLAGEVVGPAADVFAWGATIAYAANGRPPYGQDTIPAVMNRIVTSKPDLGGLAGPLRELVTQTLHKDAAKRPHSRDILLRLLEHSHGPISAPEALAKGHALAMADDVTLTSARTARWATLKLPTEPIPRSPAYRRVILIGIAAASILLVITTAIAIRLGLNDHTEPLATDSAPGTSSRDLRAKPLSSSPAPATIPSAPPAVAAAVEQAIALHKTAAFYATGAINQGDDSFRAYGRLEYRSPQNTNYDLTVGNRDGHDLTPPAHVVLIGKCVYLTAYPQVCHIARSTPSGQDDDPHIWLASEVRWVSSPNNIFALLHNSTSLERETKDGNITYRGKAHIEQLTKGPGALFYETYATDKTELSYRLVTGPDNLPQRLDIDLAVTLEPTSIVRSLYSATYRDWGKGGRIDAPTLKP